MAHTYGEPVFTWAEDGSSATATFTCTQCDHEETVDATITSEVKTEATCTVMGTTTYTATVTVDFGEGTYTSTKDVQDIPAVAHTYGEPVFTWAEDNSSVTATFVCTECQHEETATSNEVSSSVTKQPTCTEKGETTYTATVNFGDQDYPVSKTETNVEALAHTTELQNAKDATCTEEGYTGDLVCTVCGETVEKGEAIPATGHKFEDGVCTVCGEKDPNYVPPTQEPQGDVVLDNQTGDQITAGNADEVFEANTIITVVRVEDGETYTAVEQALKGVVADMKHTAILDITATLNGKLVQPSAPVQMTFAIPQHLSADNLKLFYVSDDGKTTQEIPITVDKDARTVTATIAHFSTYVLANVVADETTGTVPPTGDNSQLMLYVAALAAGVVLMSTTVVVSRKRRG